MFKDNGKDDGVTQQLQMGGQDSMSGFGDSSIIHMVQLRYNLIGKTSLPLFSDQPWITVQRQNDFE